MSDSVVEGKGKVIEASPLEVLRFVLEAGGPNADIVASATDEEIKALLDEIDTVRIIM